MTMQLLFLLMLLIHVSSSPHVLPTSTAAASASSHHNQHNQHHHQQRPQSLSERYTQSLVTNGGNVNISEIQSEFTETLTNLSSYLGLFGSISICKIKTGYWPNFAIVNVMNKAVMLRIRDIPCIAHIHHIYAPFNTAQAMPSSWPRPRSYQRV